MNNFEVFSRKDECINLVHQFFAIAIIQNHNKISSDDLKFHNEVYESLMYIIQEVNQEINRKRGD